MASSTAMQPTTVVIRSYATSLPSAQILIPAILGHQDQVQNASWTNACDENGGCPVEKHTRTIIITSDQPQASRERDLLPLDPGATMSSRGYATVKLEALLVAWPTGTLATVLRWAGMLLFQYLLATLIINEYIGPWPNPTITSDEDILSLELRLIFGMFPFFCFWLWKLTVHILWLLGCSGLLSRVWWGVVLILVANVALKVSRGTAAEMCRRDALEAGWKREHGEVVEGENVEIVD